MVDIIIIVLLLLFLIIGFASGFFKQLVGVLGGMVALVAAFLLCKPAANLIFENTEWMPSLANVIADALHLPDTTVEAQNITSALIDVNVPGFIKTSVIDIAEKLNEATVNISVIVSQTIAKYIIIIACFFLILILVKILSKFLKGLANHIKNIPVIGIVDRILGLVLGLIRGVLLVYMLLFLIDLLPFSFLDTVKTAISSSGIANFMIQHNIFIMLFSLIVVS